MFIGRKLLGYTDSEVGRLTIRKWKQQYEQYKIDYDFRLLQRSYSSLEAEDEADQEWDLG